MKSRINDPILAGPTNDQKIVSYWAREIEVTHGGPIILDVPKERLTLETFDPATVLSPSSHFYRLQIYPVFTAPDRTYWRVDCDDDVIAAMNETEWFFGQRDREDRLLALSFKAVLAVTDGQFTDEAVKRLESFGRWRCRDAWDKVSGRKR